MPNTPKARELPIALELVEFIHSWELEDEREIVDIYPLFKQKC